VKLPPGKVAQFFSRLRQGDALLRLGLCLATAAALWFATAAWAPPFGFRPGDVPQRSIVSRVAFEVPDPQQTEVARNVARQNARYVYKQNAEQLVQLRSKLINTLVLVQSAATFADLDLEIWRQFQPPIAEGGMPPTREAQEEQFERFRSALAGDGRARVEAALAQILEPVERRGLLERPQHSDGNQREIFVYPAGQPDRLMVVRVTDVLIGVQTADDAPLRRALREHPDTAPIAEQVFAWLRGRFTETLQLDPDESARVRERAGEAVRDVSRSIAVGETLAEAGQPLGPAALELLRREYEAVMANPATRPHPTWRSVAALGCYLVLLAGCAIYVGFRAPKLAASTVPLTSVLLMVVATVSVANWFSTQPWRTEIIPLLLFGMTLAIAYHRELALVGTGAVCSLLMLATGRGVGEFLVLMGVVTTAVLLLTRIRSRVKLIRICFAASGVALLLSLALGVLEGRLPDLQLLREVGLLAGWTLATGFLMTGLLPFIEKWFGVLTDLSLLELGDVSHPLLQELVQRAPGTYNHSINVASLGEAAADAIGARGLLVRVGAYFHDIGKMLKPSYFAENQADGISRHESLAPAMSTLVIIAHIKDGADLARNHHLPQPIIDFIEQHHGTTVVEYFFRRASLESQANPDLGEVHESDFRYPGPKPQTKEAAVLMLADALESASRTLVQPTPARIEGLVNDLAMKRLQDGQFDESGINLTELRKVCDSLVKSLIAVYHGRVKYPTQQTA
jgi:hypothetical protein